MLGYGNFNRKQSEMKALIYDPYLDTLGGGERYCLTVAECLLKSGWQVDFFWDREGEIQEAIQRFDLRVEKVGLIGKKPEELSFWTRVRLERRYDLIFWLSDGSIPFLFAKQNFLHFQVPFTNIRTNNLFKKILMKVKFRFIDQIVCNSQFTKRFIDQEFGVNSVVLYPPVDVEKFQPGRKENIILAVGRFEETMQTKRQDILIKTFIKMVNSGLGGWRLILIGASIVPPRENSYLKKLEKLAAGYPIEFLVNASFRTLKAHYGKAKIFWHAAGFKADEVKEPYKVEHFGMTTVEAMAAGCVPVVIDKGGLREIVRRGVGERWNTVGGLIVETAELIKSRKKWRQCSLAAQKSSRRFNKYKFCGKLTELSQG